MLRHFLFITIVLVVSLTMLVSVEHAVAWHDPSRHSIQFVSVEDNVKLEVLDWGGSGRALILLAGLGNTAHVYDDFAPKLTGQYHVYGVTRRGYGASSSPETGYSADRLGDDIVAVLDALKIERPVLVGHSIAGEELSSVAARHPNRVAGLVYLDAAYPYAYYYRGAASLDVDVAELQSKLDQLLFQKGPPDQSQLVRDLLQKNLPLFKEDLQEMQELEKVAPAKPAKGPSPGRDDLASFPAFRAWVKRVQGIDFPEAELRETHETRPDGGVGKTRPGPASAIMAGEQRYADIRLPVLAIYANPKTPGPYAHNSPAERAAAEAMEENGVDALMKAFQAGVPCAHVVRLANANHYVFLSNETDVLREMNEFLADLP